MTASIDAELKGNVLTVRLRNSGDKAIRVDKELVFLLRILPLDTRGNVVPLKEVEVFPAPDPSTLGQRFILLAPGGVIQRQIHLARPFKQFTYATSYPHGRISAYEANYMLPKTRRVRRLAVEYGLRHGARECLEFYLRGGIPEDLYLGPLECEVQR